MKLNPLIVQNAHKDIVLKANWGIGSLHIRYNMYGNDVLGSSWSGRTTYSANANNVYGAAEECPVGVQSDGYVWGYTDASQSKQSVYEELFPILPGKKLENFDVGLSDIHNFYWISFNPPKGYHVEEHVEWYAIVDGQKKYFDESRTDYTIDDFVGKDYDPNDPKDYVVTLYANWTNVTGWRQIYGNNKYQWMYVNDDGSIAKNGWKIIDGKYYYFGDTNQSMAKVINVDTNWLAPQMGWYAYQNEWGYINGKYYRFADDCSMLTGWYNDGTYWYYLTTQADHDQWGTGYPVGSMLANTFFDQNGKRYWFDEYGHCTNP